MKRIDRNIFAIDLKSFYASVECLDRNLDPFKTPLVVADESRGDGTIVLAASPFIKEKYGVKSRCRLYDVPKDIPGLIIAQPKMRRYLEKSADINDIYLRFVSEEDLYVYSIDESFLDVTNYLRISGDTPRSYALKIIRAIFEETGLTVTAGIGLNLFMAKAAMDIEAKKNPDLIAEWTYEDIPKKLWPVSPLSKMWGIGQRMEKRLNNMGFFTVGDIAVSDPKFLKKKLGVIGEEIYHHALGYDDALLQESVASKDRSISCGQILLRDYFPEEMKTLIYDMSIELSIRLHKERILASEFDLFLAFKDHRGGHHLRCKFDTPTDSSEKIASAFVREYKKIPVSEAEIFRSIHLIANSLSPIYCYQGSLFENYEEDNRLRVLEDTMIQIRERFGAHKAMPCSALSFSSTFLARSNQIGGHHA